MNTRIFNSIVDAETVPMFYEKTGIKPNILIAYHNLRGNTTKLTRTYRDMIGLLYVDSGAYGVFTGNIRIDVHEYLDFLNVFGEKFDAFFTLDDRFDNPEHNLFRQLYLEKGLAKKKLLPIPVIHDEKDPMNEFEMYADLGHTYIALGSRGEDKQISPDFLDKIQKEHSNIKIHMFGNLNRKMLFKYRPYSADASTWAVLAGMGMILYWDPEDKKEYKIYAGTKSRKTGDFVHYKDFHKKDRLDSFLSRTFKWKYEDLFKTENRQVVNLYFFNQLETHLSTASLEVT